MTSRRGAVASALSAALVTGCTSIGPSATLASPTPVFAPQLFFAGHTIGRGTLHVALSHARAVQVAGDGRVEPDGSLILHQRVMEGNKPPRDRTWHLHDLGGGRLAVTLSDATGPVEADVAGNRLHVRFDTAGGLRVEQWIYLQAGGDIAANRMVVRKFGLPVASLRETIQRVP